MINLIACPELINGHMVLTWKTQEDLLIISKAKQVKEAKKSIESFVYFISNGKSIKIGKSNNPEGRLYDLQTANHTKLTLLHTIGFKTQSDCFEAEKTFHKKYKKYRERGEWFAIPEELQKEWNELKENK